MFLRLKTRHGEGYKHSWARRATVFLVFICLSTQVSAEDAKTLVQEAKDYLKYKPATSLQILIDNKTIIEASAPQTKVDAYVTGLWAALYQDNNDVADHYASLLVKYSQADAFEQNLYPILAGMVSTLRKNEAYKEAEMFAVCMVDVLNNKLRLLTVALSLGAVYRAQGLYEQAKTLYQFGIELSKQLKREPFAAGFHNNLGVIALNERRYQDAVAHFTTAANLRHQQAHMSGQIKASTNLMLAYFFLQDWQSFERAAARVKPLAEKHASQSMGALYHWLLLAKDMKSISTLGSTSNQEMQQYFDQLDHSVQFFVNEAANTVGLTTTYAKQKSTLPPPNVTEYFSMCRWDVYQDMSFTKILTLIKSQASRD